MNKRPTKFDQKLLNAAVSFHGHLGPYLVLGLRMGILANRTLRPNSLHDMSVKVWTRRSPPESCLLDGIQFASGCTIGNGNLTLKDAFQARARFSKGDESLFLSLSGSTAKVLRRIPGHDHDGIEKLAICLGKMSDRKMFLINRSMSR